ncbi:hypothetical protein LJC59_05395, partial [Desulfovibrio sp. OttesenSCG-928-A18]|nr:hypothetical protein [Desulfovibrio sp. OttesenSCG-928-A18]
MDLSGLDAAGALILALYAALVLYTAARAGRKMRPEAFFVNSRSSGAFSVAFSIIVSCVGASATMGMIGMAFAIGTPAFWWLGMGAVGLCCLALFLARAVRASGAMTLPELSGRLLGPAARPLIAVLVVLAWPAILAAQFAALTQVLQPLTGCSRTVALFLGFFLVVAHSMGGQAAIMRTDRLQALLLLLALTFMLAWLGARNPAWASFTRLELVNADFPPRMLLYFFFVVGANYLVCPMLFGRVLSARDAGAARRGVFMAAAGLALCAALIVCVGLACRGLLPEATAGDAVLTTALAVLFPPWMQIVVSLALVSAIVSSADSCLVTAATVLGHDLLRRDGTGVNRACVFAVGLAGLGLSLLDKGILGFLLMAYDVYACGVVAPVFAGIMLHGRRRIDSRYACAAILCGGVLGLVSALGSYKYLAVAGLSLSALITLAGCAFAIPPGWRRPQAPCKGHDALDPH